MLSQLYSQINWHAPWYAPLIIPPLFIQPYCCVKDWLNASLTQPIMNYQHKAIRFVPQDNLPVDTAYETYIAKTGNIPTRDNLHDLLGGLIWLNFPKTKAVFNQLHQQDIEKTGIQPTRSVIRNILTLFDENGGVVVSSDMTVLQGLQSFNWQSALFDNRNSWLNHQTNFFPIGHALLEKLIEPRDSITAHVMLLYVAPDWHSQDVASQRVSLDNFLSQFFLTLPQAHHLTSKMFQPLPVLGIAQFRLGQSRDFYANKTIFREPRSAPPSPIYSLSLTKQ